MQLTHLSFRNFKKLRNFDTDLQPGVTGIVGPNGVGKSSFIKGIEFLITGNSSLAKDQLITLGETDGYVRGEFNILGKAGSIERHLGISKTVLKYDGQELKTATAVKSLWEKLFQIDPHIFHNVIIAHQNQIPALFDSDDSVREKIFQKIFMTPPTDKIRAVIWDHYISKCPPPLPEANIIDLRKQITSQTAQLNDLMKVIDLTKSKILTDADVSKVTSEILFLNQCRQDAITRKTLEPQLATLEVELATLEREYRRLEQELQVIDVNALSAKMQELDQAKGVHSVKLKLEARLNQVKAIPEIPKEDYDSAVLMVATNNATIAQYNEKLASLHSKIRELSTTLSRFASLTGHATCPTCMQQLADVQLFVNEQTKIKMEFTLEMQQLTASVNELKAASVKVTETTITPFEYRNAELKKVQQELEPYGDTGYDDGLWIQCKAALREVAEKQNKYREAGNSWMKVNSDIALKKQTLESLKTYTGTDPIDDVVNLYQQVLQVNQERTRELNQLLVSQATLTASQNYLNDQIVASTKNHEYNLKREHYLNTLQQVYELLHASKFPRHLIESYSAIVQEELAVQLAKFNLPYTAEVGSGFKIIMRDAEGRELPEVSGGQKVIVGLCLRLALHSLFGQSFPMLIIDEGTTNLHEDNVKLYFEFIQGLRSDSKLNQIFIIDHHEGLKNSVDNVIRIE